MRTSPFQRAPQVQRNLPLDFGLLVRVRIGDPHKRGHASERYMPPSHPASERGLHHARSLLIGVQLLLHLRGSALCHLTGERYSVG